MCSQPEPGTTVSARASETFVTALERVIELVSDLPRGPFGACSFASLRSLASRKSLASYRSCEGEGAQGQRGLRDFDLDALGRSQPSSLPRPIWG